MNVSANIRLIMVAKLIAEIQALESMADLPDMTYRAVMSVLVDMTTCSCWHCHGLRQLAVTDTIWLHTLWRLQFPTCHAANN